MLMVANQRMKVAGEDITKPVFGEKGQDLAPRAPKHESDEVCLTKPGMNRKITLEEFRAQDRQQPWFVVNGEVYDGTPFLKDHPGGGDSILLVAGEDASEDFFAIHSAEGKQKLAEVSPRDFAVERWFMGRFTAPHWYPYNQFNQRKAHYNAVRWNLSRAQPMEGCRIVCHQADQPRFLPVSFRLEKRPAARSASWTACFRSLTPTGYWGDGTEGIYSGIATRRRRLY